MATSTLAGRVGVNVAYKLTSEVLGKDGTKIAFMSDREGNLDIYVMAADGSSPINLTNHSALDFEPAWFPIMKTVIEPQHRVR